MGIVIRSWSTVVHFYFFLAKRLESFECTAEGVVEMEAHERVKRLRIKSKNRKIPAHYTQKLAKIDKSEKIYLTIYIYSIQYTSPSDNPIRHQSTRLLSVESIHIGNHQWAICPKEEKMEQYTHFIIPVFWVLIGYILCVMRQGLRKHVKISSFARLLTVTSSNGTATCEYRIDDGVVMPTIKHINHDDCPCFQCKR